MDVRRRPDRRCDSDIQKRLQSLVRIFLNFGEGTGAFSLIKTKIVKKSVKKVGEPPGQ